MSQSEPLPPVSRSFDSHTPIQLPWRSVPNCGTRSYKLSLFPFVFSSASVDHVCPLFVEREYHASKSPSDPPKFAGPSQTAIQLPVPSVKMRAYSSMPVSVVPFVLSSAGTVQLAPALDE